MLTKLHLKNFKGFRDTEIPELRKVNLILGRQNVGKTTLLEGIVFGSVHQSGLKKQDLYHSLPFMFRPGEGSDKQRFWKSLLGTVEKPTNAYVQLTNQESSFYAGPTQLMNESSSGSGMLFGDVMVSFGKSSADSTVPPNGITFSHSFPYFTKSASEQVKLYGEMVVQRKKKSVLELLRQIDRRLESLDAVAPDDEFRIYAELNDGTVLTLSQLGHGFTRLFELYAGLAVSDSKLALIDEIENGIHYSALPTVFQGLRNISEAQDVQSIITTHSLEAIEAACEIFKDKPEDFQLIRLERTNDNNIRAVAIADESLKIVMASGWEMR